MNNDTPNSLNRENDEIEDAKRLKERAAQDQAASEQAKADVLGRHQKENKAPGVITNKDGSTTTTKAPGTPDLKK